MEKIGEIEPTNTPAKGENFWEISYPKYLDTIPTIQEIVSKDELLAFASNAEEKEIIEKRYDTISFPYYKLGSENIENLYNMPGYPCSTKIQEKYPILKKIIDHYSPNYGFEVFFETKSIFENILWKLSSNIIKENAVQDLIKAFQEEENTKDVPVLNSFYNDHYYRYRDYYSNRDYFRDHYRKIKNVSNISYKERAGAEDIFDILSYPIHKTKDYQKIMLDTLLFPSDREEFLSIAFLDKIMEIFPYAKEYIEDIKDARKRYEENGFLETASQRMVSLHQRLQMLETEKEIKQEFLVWLEKKDKNIYLAYKQNLSFSEYNSSNGLWEFASKNNKGVAIRNNSIKKIYKNFSTLLSEFCQQKGLPYGGRLIEGHISETTIVNNIPEYLSKNRENNHSYLNIPFQDLDNYFAEKKNIHLSGDLGMGKDILLSVFLEHFKKKHPNTGVYLMDGTRFQNNYRLIAKTPSTEKSEKIDEFLSQFGNTKLFIVENLHNITGKWSQKTLSDLIKQNKAQFIGISKENLWDFQRSEDGKTSTNFGSLYNPQLVNIPFPSNPDNRAAQFEEWRNAKFIELPEECQNFPQQLFEGIRRFVVEAQCPTEKYETIINAVISDYKRHIYEAREINLGEMIFETLSFLLGENLFAKEEDIIEVVINTLDNSTEFLKEEYRKKRKGINKEMLFQKKVERSSPEGIALGMILLLFNEYFFNTKKMSKKEIANYFNKNNTLHYISVLDFFNSKREYKELENIIKEEIMKKTKEHYGITHTTEKS